MVVQLQQTTAQNRSSFSRPNPCIGCFKNNNRVTRDFFTPGMARVSIQHNFVTTLSHGCRQGCDSFNYKVVSSLSQGCHKVATRLLWQPCGTTLSFLYGTSTYDQPIPNWRGCGGAQDIPAKTNLQDHARLCKNACKTCLARARDMSLFLHDSCTILHQFLQDLAKSKKCR